MANVFTNLEQDALLALNTVLQKRAGFVNAVRSDFSAENLAKDRTIRSFVTPQNALANTSPSANPPDTGDHTWTNRTFSIDNDKHYAIRWTAEDLMQMNGGGPGSNPMLQEQLAQAYQALLHDMDQAIAAKYVEASRAHTPIGTNLFDSSGGIKDIAAAKQILVDNGALEDDISLVVGSASNVNLLGISNLYKANEAGSDDFLRRGILGEVFNVQLRHSANVKTHSTGAMDSATTDDSGYAVGATEITLATAGTGVVAAGDIISFAGDSNEYVVKAVSFAGSNPASGDTITIQEPGLKEAIAGSATNISVVDQGNERNMIFHRNAIALATRLPAYIPGEADQVVVVQDPSGSGLSFQILTYYEHKRMHMQVGIAYGVGVMKPEMLALVAD